MICFNVEGSAVVRLSDPESRMFVYTVQEEVVVNRLSDCGCSMQELQRFFVVAQVFKEDTGAQAYMPACPVDSVWHRLLREPTNYNQFCHKAVGREVRHEPLQGEGEISWTKTYERLHGPLPEIWFCDVNGSLDVLRREKYLSTGVFYASWDCTPY